MSMDVTAADTPVRLSTGELLIVSQLTNRDMMTVFKLVQKKQLSNLVAAIPADLPKETYNSAYREAVKMSKEFSVEDLGTALQDMADLEIIELMTTLSLRKRQPNITHEKIGAIIDNPADFESVMNAMNGTGESDVPQEESSLPPVPVQP